MSIKLLIQGTTVVSDEGTSERRQPLEQISFKYLSR